MHPPIEVRRSASAHRRTYVLSGRRPKPDVGNLINEQAHAPLPLPAGHARMPPGRISTEFVDWGFHAPHLRFQEEQDHCASFRFSIKRNVRVRDA
jgi:hypothetical protein